MRMDRAEGTPPLGSSTPSQQRYARARDQLLQSPNLLALNGGVAIIDRSRQPEEEVEEEKDDEEDEDVEIERRNRLALLSRSASRVIIRRSPRRAPTDGLPEEE